jgi:signal peptide peptidase SppA
VSGQALAQLLDRPLLFEQRFLESVVAALTGTTTPQPVARRAAATLSSASPREGGLVGVLSVFGPISYRGDWLSWLFGGCSVVEIRTQLQQLLTERRVDTIVVVFDTPGGEVVGLEELAFEIREARKVKPVFALIDCLAASAGYWLAAQADEILATPSAIVGSCGVFLLHLDRSQQLAEIGIRPTFIASAPFKVEGNELQPLSDAARSHLQAEVDRVHGAFVADLVKGRGRGLTPARVAKDFGQGRTVAAADAVRVRMVDRIFPTPAQAFAYAAGSAERRRVRADQDASDWWMVEHGDAGERSAALRRLERRADVETPVDPAQVDADIDYAAASITIAEARGK